jgi:ketol-acid reductoisomerase
MIIVYRDEDADLKHLNGKTVGVIGYGNLGRAMALNLRDSGVQVMVGVNTPQSQQAAADEDFTTEPIAQVVKRAPLLMLLIPDEVMPEVYLQDISPHLQRGHTLIFGSAYNVAFGYIEPPPFVDVGLIAPRTLGVSVRERFMADEGFLSFVAVGQDASGKAWQDVLALAKALGSLREGAIEVAFEREAELDLFVQQAILPAFHHIMVTAAELLMEMGYPPELVFTELYLSGELSDYLQRASQSGLLSAMRLASLTSQYGTFSRLDRFNELKLQRLMEVTLDEIRHGHFAKEWAKEYGDGYHRLKKLLRAQEGLDMWEMEKQAIELLNPDQRFDDEDFTD